MNSRDTESIERTAERVRLALEAADLSAFGDLLDQKVTWGPPGDKSPPCRNKQQVLAWYERAKASGASAQVNEVVVDGSHILVGLVVSGTESARQRGGLARRWQVLTLRESHIIDITGFEQEIEALDWINTQP